MLAFEALKQLESRLKARRQEIRAITKNLDSYHEGQEDGILIAMAELDQIIKEVTPLDRQTL